MKVFIYRGIPGSGKSTLIKKSHERVCLCSADTFFETPEGYKFDYTKLGEAHAACLKKYVTRVSGAVVAFPEEDLIVDNTNTTVSEIAPYAALALAYGHELKIITILCPPEAAFKRNIHGVKLRDIMEMDYRVRTSIPHIPKYWPHEVVLAEEGSPAAQPTP